MPEGDWRVELANKAATVSGFVKMLTTTITFGATAAGAPVLAAMSDLAEQLASEAKWTVRNRRIHPAVVTGPYVTWSSVTQPALMGAWTAAPTPSACWSSFLAI